MKELMLATVKRSTPEEIAQLLCDLHEESNALRKDKERLDWMEKTQAGINFNVGCCQWGVDYDAPTAPDLREAIDVAMYSANDQGEAQPPAKRL